MIVVSILGILAAIVFPEFQNHIRQAKEAQAKTNLKLLRETIERYYNDHGVAPGYPGNDPSKNPGYLHFLGQLTGEPQYLPKLPKNPFNDQSSVQVLLDAGTLATPPAEYNAAYGWLYHPATRTVKLNTPGADSENVNFFDY